MTRKPPKRRTPEEIRAGTRRLGLILSAIAVAFFVAAFVKQIWFS
ncbi:MULTISPECIES: cytochrome oxidase small assembly protein [unclassified Paraburkholderia]|nr:MULTISPECIES: cytochrome oxidase small assembly protein [unclassified Paraburkholderia]MDQ7981219.1 cytochrome oxidase small assembly protein [Paraburkholderia sp. SARCC-3016]